MTGARIACVIPALNAAPTLGGVVAGVRAAVPGCHVIVVDDGSRDDTECVARAVADALVRFARNRGKGAALRCGFQAALDAGAEVVLTVDADGQHDPRFAPLLVAALTDAELAIGARSRQGTGMPLGRRLTNRMSAAAVARCIGRGVDDAQSGFRALTRALVADVKPRGDRYEFETELLILAARRGHRVTFVPVPTIYGSIVPSQFRPMRDSARIVGTLWRFAVGSSA